MERPLLVALPAEPFDSAEAAAPRVDQKSLVTIRQNRYSVPVALAGLKVSPRASARARSRSATAASVVARHERLHGKFATSAQLDHYLELLQRKPGGLEHSVALAQERDRGAWPACFDELWAALTDRYGRSDAGRADGRRRVALPRARPRAGRARGPRRADRGRDRRPRGRGPRPPRRQRADRAARRR